MTFDPMNLPRASEWRAAFDGSPGLLEFIGEQLGATAAVALARFFWPTFVEVEGCVLLEHRYDSRRFEEWRTELGDRLSEIEATINHVHLWDVFDVDAEQVPDAAMTYLAEVLAKTWRCALAERFPDREFRVEVTGEPDDYGPTITVRSAAS